MVWLTLPRAAALDHTPLNAFLHLDQGRRTYISPQQGFGWENLVSIENGLRVHIPQGTASPGWSRMHVGTVGGAQALVRLAEPVQSAVLSYQVRFPEDFPFQRGGKLPGLYGGTGMSGCSDVSEPGFSTRLMWRAKGQGEVYLYDADRAAGACGRSLKGSVPWFFTPGHWHQIRQEVTLNTPGQANGRLVLWVDGQKVVHRSDIRFRDTAAIALEGLFFSVFFGGKGQEWVTPYDTVIEFKDLSVHRLLTVFE